MWTNIFRIGELQTVSWFQFLPLDPDPTSLSNKNAKAEQKDVANFTVISAHLQLQNEGFLTTWTNSFVGPWDPSQGAHNPDEKIKLWLFIPGRNTSLSESAQSAVSKLRVIANGVWISPGDSEEVSLALSQALRNSLERAMRGLSYVRFGDVFARISHSGQSERSLRKARTTVEFIFAATEEAIYVHAIISAKYVRSLCGDDIEKILIHSSNSSSDGLPVIVAPNGMLGRLTGCCPSELVKKVYTSKIKSSNGAPYVNQSPGCQMRGQSFYVEIALGCNNKDNNNNIPYKEAQDEANNTNTNTTTTTSTTTTNINNNMERTFIFPPESVLIPMMHRAFSHFSSKRFWIQNSTEISQSETWPFWNFSGPSFVEHCLAVGTTCHVESSRNSSCLRLKRHYRNNNNNNSGSSSVSSTSSEEAEMDSTASKQNNKGVKRTHSETLEAGKSNNNLAGNHLMDASDSKRGPVWANCLTMDEDELAGCFELQPLLFEFGDFGDFFENELYAVGDPLGTAASQALTLPSTDLGELTITSPLTLHPQLETMPDHPLSSPVSVPSLQSPFSPPVPQIPNTIKSPQPIKHLIPFSEQNVQLSKAEAMLTFAPEYAAIEFGGNERERERERESETLILPFRNPYRPSSKKAESCNSSHSYVYGAAPPPAGADSDENREASSKLYTLVQSHKTEIIKPNVINNNNDGSNNAEVSDMSGMTSLSTSNNNNKKNESAVFDASNLVMPSKLSLATDMDCIMHQATMCKSRHTLLSLKSKPQNQPHNQITIKKENIPIRIGGDLDSDLTTDRTSPVVNPVGVWRSISGPKPIKQNDEGLTANVSTRNPLMDFLVGLGLLVQNSASFVDLSLDYANGEGPYCWLALEEQKRRGFACEPEMVHAGCGGLLASCHSLDLAGVDLVDPLNADVSVPAVMSLLQSDIKQAVKSAFGTSDGPLSVVDWCKGRAHDGPKTAASNAASDPYSFLNDSSSGVTMGGGAGDLSPPLSTTTSSTHRDGQRRSNQDSSNSEQEQDKGFNSRSRPTLAVLPTPSILIGYQDDWLKASVNCVQLWEKTPLEPYALPKPVSYYAICPDIELLTTAAVDFFQQLGTVYEICKLGTLDASSSKPGLVLLEAPQQLKPPKTHLLTSISDYFLSLSKHWTPKSFLNSLSKLLKTLKLSPHPPLNPKESSGSPTTVIYVICPFPEPSSILQTLVEASVSLGTAVLSPSEKDKKYLLHAQVSCSLNPNSSSTGEDLLSNSSSLTVLSGFSHPKLVLQIISIETLLKLNSPSLNELSLLKDIAFTVYTKSRRVAAKPLLDPVHHSSFPSSRSQMMHHMTSAGSHVPGLWKDCLVPRALNARDSSDFDPTYNTWQRNNNISVPLSADPYSLEDKKYLFEPLFILAEPGSLDHHSNALSDAASEGDSSNEPSPASLHCCYGWTEDWRWFVCIWTDSRGELLDSFIFPFGGISGRQDTKVLQGLFVQVLQQGCQIVAGSCGNDGVGSVRPRDVVIARLGGFFELECQEWQKAIYSIGGNEVRKWPIQLRQGLNPNPNPNSQDSTFIPASSQNPSSLYSKSSFMKSGPGPKKPLMDSSKGPGSGSTLHLMQSITLVGVSVDHSLRLILPAESAQSASSTTTTAPNHLEGFTPVKSLSSFPSSYLLIPSPNLKPLSLSPLSLPTSLTSLSPPLAHLLHSKGTALPVSTCYLASKSVPPIRRDISENVKDDWPSVVAVSLVDYYGGGGRRKGGGEEGVRKEVMETVGAELNGLSWLTVSPVYGERRSVLPFHCDMVMRMRRLLCYAERELERASG